ncbi:hypothetical protein AUJ35_00105 [Candidatus Falkowbacteria bacterium CG1_02_41_21]|uniref:Glycosyl transferase family 1 n=2 Tax=Candidatus Falkowiibacteriota TaxID=1752728 RepID=A0A1J4TCG2_9BACT|nr:MAG: hypothetical protein AUJ35_00105 [Candidatus Falkowbacteria bacterium CG1_02_41_21]
MKIALIGQKGIPVTHGGGVEKHVENLAVRLVELGHEVIVYTRHGYTDKRLKEYKGVKLVGLPSVPTKNLDAISHTFLAALDVIFRKVDVVHFHSIGPSSLIWLVKLFKPHTPVISTFHSQCYHNQKWGFFAKNYLRFGEYMCSQKADTVITVSKSLLDHVMRKYPTAHAKYIPNGVNIPEMLPAQEITDKWGLTKDSYILNIGRLVANKGVEYLIAAYKQIKTDKKLVIVGDGIMEEKLKRLADRHPNIIFTGNQSGQNLGELFSNAYIFVQPSESEGLSIALLEAMSYRNPCLVSDIPANREVVGENGFTFKTMDESDLKTKLEELLTSPDKLKANKEAMYNKVVHEYDWSKIVDNIVLIYTQARAKK